MVKKRTRQLGTSLNIPVPSADEVVGPYTPKFVAAWVDDLVAQGYVQRSHTIDVAGLLVWLNDEAAAYENLVLNTSVEPRKVAKKIKRINRLIRELVDELGEPAKTGLFGWLEIELYPKYPAEKEDAPMGNTNRWQRYLADVASVSRLAQVSDLAVRDLPKGKPGRRGHGTAVRVLVSRYLERLGELTRGSGKTLRPYWNESPFADTVGDKGGVSHFIHELTEPLLPDLTEEQIARMIRALLSA